MTKRGVSPGLIVTQVGPVILYVGLIFALSTLPQSQLSPATSWLTLPYADKLIHFTEYTILGALGFRALFLKGRGLSPKHAFPVMLVLGSLCGLCDELYQSTVPTRDASAFDWLADFGGIFFGICIMRWILCRTVGLPARADTPKST